MTDGKSKLAVSVDVEDWYHNPTVTGSSFSTYADIDAFFDDWDRRYDYLTKPTHRTLDLFDDLGITATFFIVGDVVDNYPGLVKEISNRGHEIGCHGLHHACAISPDTKEPRFTQEEYRERLVTAKTKLEEVTGQEVTGYRAPGAYIGGWVLEILDDLDFEYDSSVANNSLYNKTDDSLKNVGSTPYLPGKTSLQPEKGSNIVEFPWPYYQPPIGNVRIPTAGGPLIRLFGRRIVQAGIEQSLERGTTVFYFHPIDISREQFPNVGNNTRRPGLWIRKGKPAENRIYKLLTEVGTERTATHDEILNRLLNNERR